MQSWSGEARGVSPRKRPLADFLGSKAGRARAVRTWNSRFGSSCAGGENFCAVWELHFRELASRHRAASVPPAGGKFTLRDLSRQIPRNRAARSNSSKGTRAAGSSRMRYQTFTFCLPRGRNRPAKMRARRAFRLGRERPIAGGKLSARNSRFGMADCGSALPAKLRQGPQPPRGSDLAAGGTLPQKFPVLPPGLQKFLRVSRNAAKAERTQRLPRGLRRLDRASSALRPAITPVARPPRGRNRPAKMRARRERPTSPSFAVSEA